MVVKRGYVAGWVLATLVGAMSCSGEVAPHEGESHWLGACDRDADCGRGKCLCGVCTEVCEGDHDCAGDAAGAACFLTASPGLSPSCAASTIPGDGVCLALCEEAECPRGTTCHLGACLDPAGEEPAAAIDRLESGMAASYPNQLPPIERPPPVDEALDFSDPVVLPPPTFTFSGPDALVGDWDEVHPGGEPCTLENQTAGRGDNACAHMTIDVAEGGALSGTLRWQAEELASVKGPFAPAVDPSVGYPTDVSTEDYHRIASLIPEVPYRILDGRIEAGTLSFWVSGLDLFSDWCAMQTPYRVEIDGDVEYRCVPGDADETNTELGVLALCTSMYDGPDCLGSSGERRPCVCIRDEANEAIWPPLCTEEFCECFREGCRPNWRVDSTSFRLVLEGDVLEGTTIRGGVAYPFHLKRASP